MTHIAFEKAHISKGHAQWMAEAMEAEKRKAYSIAAHCWKQACNTTLSVGKSAAYLENHERCLKLAHANRG